MTQLASQGSKYTDVQRRHALGVFVVLGNYQATANETNIPYRTVHEWSKKEWWLKLLEEVRREKADELDTLVTNGIHKAIDSVTDRLDDGDAYLRKDGEIGYKPVSARDSATVLGILYDKRQIMRLLPTTITQTTDSNKLLKLQEKFEALAGRNAKVIEGEVIVEG